MISRTMRMIAALCGLALSACVVSVNPVVAPPDATFDERLLGTWQEVGGTDRAVVSRGTARSYALAYTIKGETLRLEGRLGRLGDRTVLDVWPVPREHDLATEYAGLFLPAHLAVILALDERELAISLFQPDSLHASLLASRVRPAPAPALVERRLVLDGSTSEVRAILAESLVRRGALEKAATYRRVEEPGR